MNQLLIILISYFSLAVTNIGEKAETKRVEKPLGGTEVVKPSVIKSQIFLSTIYKCVNR
jgi:hypothetical protein